MSHNSLKINRQTKWHFLAEKITALMFGKGGNTGCEGCILDRRDIIGKMTSIHRLETIPEQRKTVVVVRIQSPFIAPSTM